MREKIKDFVNKSREAFSQGDMKTALGYWIYIYDEFDKSEDFLELREAMSKFTDEEVYAITDYYKEITGYYS